MLIGYNNDVEYRGKEFHIQTEDHGENDPRIESQVFHQGQILDTEIISYVSILKRFDDEEEAHEKVKSLMWKTHKGLYERLVSGAYDERVGLEPLEEDDVDAPAPDEFKPGQDRVPTAAKVVEEKGEEAFEQFHEQEARKHVDLHSLKDQLGDEEGEAPDAEPSEADDGDDEMPEEEHLPDVPIASIESVGDDEDEDEPELEATEAADGGSEAERSSGPLDGGSQLADLEGAESFGGDDAADAAQTTGTPTGGTAIGRDDESSGGVPRTETEPMQSGNSSSDEATAPGPGESRETMPLSRHDSERLSGTSSTAETDDEPSDAPRDSWPSTGRRAWRGCEEPEGVVSIVPLVEAFFDA